MKKSHNLHGVSPYLSVEVACVPKKNNNKLSVFAFKFGAVFPQWLKWIINNQCVWVLKYFIWKKVSVRI